MKKNNFQKLSFKIFCAQLILLFNIIVCNGNLFNNAYDPSDDENSNPENKKPDANAPIAESQNIIINQNIAANITLKANEPNGKELIWNSSKAPQNGNISGTMPKIIYTPNTGYTGKDSFSFFVNNGSVDSNIGTVDITILPLANWGTSDMGVFTYAQNFIAMGNGRNDNVIRIYTASDDANSNIINEFSYVTDHWEKLNFGDFFFSVRALALGKVQNDSLTRVYANCSSDIYEYSYSAGSWPGAQSGLSPPFFDDIMILGNGQNDGVTRIYIDWFTDSGIAEISNSNGDWNVSSVDNSGNASGMVVANARNDGIQRLYATIRGSKHVFEYTWANDKWNLADCGLFNVDYDFTSITAGDGRNDGKTRIYLTGSSKGISELSYEDGIWQQTIISQSAIVLQTIVAKARDDDLFRLYSSSDIGIGEYSYGGTWAKTSNIPNAYPVTAIAVGDGRNDGKNRIYATADDNHVYEYSSQ